MSPRRRSLDGRYTVSGPYEDDHPVPTVGAGMGVGQTFATRHRKVQEELTYYVRDLTGRCFAYVTKHVSGEITIHQTEGGTT